MLGFELVSLRKIWKPISNVAVQRFVNAKMTLNKNWPRLVFRYSGALLYNTRSNKTSCGVRATTQCVSVQGHQGWIYGDGLSALLGKSQCPRLTTGIYFNPLPPTKVNCHLTYIATSKCLIMSMLDHAKPGPVHTPLNCRLRPGGTPRTNQFMHRGPHQPSWKSPFHLLPRRLTSRSSAPNLHCSLCLLNFAWKF